VLVAISCFALGMVLQALFMIGGRFRAGTWGRAAGVLGSWFIGLVPASMSRVLRALHVSYGMLRCRAVFTYLFRDACCPASAAACCCVEPAAHLRRGP